MQLHTLLRRTIGALLLLCSAAPALAAQGPEMLLHMLDYIRVDYPATVHNQQIIDAEEYAEMQEFSSQAVEIMAKLEPAAPVALRQQAEQLKQAIAQRQAPAEITRQVLALSQGITSGYDVTVSPRLAPKLANGQQLYNQLCASCHGAEGYGDGAQAVSLTPPPINFHDMSRQQERSPWGLYSAISRGVEGTSMPGFQHLNEEQRWALAFYVANFPFTAEQREAGQRLWEMSQVRQWVPDLATLSGMTVAEAEQQFGSQGRDVVAFLRNKPEVLTNGSGALVTARELLAASMTHYKNGKVDKAYQLALSAYLDGYELAEAGLASHSAELAASLEQSMLGFREQLRSGAPTSELQQQYDALQARLEYAEREMSESSMSASMGFVSTFVILLREGLEAILLLAAIAAVLIKLGRKDTLLYLHAGWIGALILGGATWAVSNYLFAISGAGRELTEGLTALLACAVLLYVGFWLHDKTHTSRWREFVDNKVRRALHGKNLWVLTLIAFIAVYREVFETVLFYQALWLQAPGEIHNSLWGGIIAAAFTLLALGWVILRSSIRLPLKLVFRLNAAVLFILAIVFAGHGVAGLQEAGWLPVDLVALPSLNLLGIYPTLETLGAQLAVIAVVSFIFLRQRLRPATTA